MKSLEVDGSDIDGAVPPIPKETMEVFLYNSTVCRLCGEENDNGTVLYVLEDNNTSLSEIVNTYLPIKVIAFTLKLY